MNITKNPRILQRRLENIWKREMTINGENLAVMALTLNKLFPKQFYAKNIRDYFENYADTVKMFNDFDDLGIKEQKLAEYLSECPYITDELIGRIMKHFERRAVTKLDRAIYDEPNLAGLLGENLTLMLMQLHYDHGFGEKRILRTVQAVCESDYPDPIKTLEEAFEIGYINSDLRAEVAELEKRRRESKRHDRNEVKNQREAERYLEEFRRIMK